MISINFRDYLNYHVQWSRCNHTEDIERINSLLAKYGLKVNDCTDSPAVTTYTINLNVDSKIKQLLNLESNFAIACKDNNTRVYQDGDKLCIEKKGTGDCVYLGDLYNERFLNCGGRLVMMIGKDTKGNNIYTDLADAPHILVAGTTGSGKSIFLHSAICSLLMKHADIEMYIIDPKIQEYKMYSYLDNVTQVTTLEEAERTLTMLAQLMDSRYSQYSNQEEMIAAGEKPIVVVIDELADLMDQGGKKTIEPLLTRIAQKARACGIHLIVATQYPIVKYVTGALKANIPVKVALKTNSITESRVMLDQKGAETLRGNGDILFRGKTNYEPIRVQGCFVTPIEIKNIVVLTKGTIPEPKQDLYSAVFTPKKSFLQRLFGR